MGVCAEGRRANEGFVLLRFVARDELHVANDRMERLFTCKYSKSNKSNECITIANFWVIPVSHVYHLNPKMLKL